MLGTAPTVFVSGNDAAAKTVVRKLLTDMGWQHEWILDLGGIETARGPEAVMLLVPDIVKARGFKPFAVGVAA